MDDKKPFSNKNMLKDSAAIDLQNLLNPADDDDHFQPATESEIVEHYMNTIKAITMFYRNIRLAITGEFAPLGIQKSPDDSNPAAVIYFIQEHQLEELIPIKYQEALTYMSHANLSEPDLSEEDQDAITEMQLTCEKLRADLEKAHKQENKDSFKLYEIISKLDDKLAVIAMTHGQ